MFVEFIQMEVPPEMWWLKFWRCGLYTNIYLWLRSTRWCKVVFMLIFGQIYRLNSRRKFIHSHRPPPDESASAFTLIICSLVTNVLVKIPEILPVPRRPEIAQQYQHMIVKVSSCEKRKRKINLRRQLAVVGIGAVLISKHSYRKANRKGKS